MITILPRLTNLSENLPFRFLQFCRLNTITLAAIAIASSTQVAVLAAGPAADNATGQAAATPEWTKVLRTAFAANISGNTDEAYSRYRNAVAAAEKVQDTKGMIICLSALADFLDSRDILKDQERPRQRALEMSEKKFGASSPEYAQQLAKRGGWHAKNGSKKEARADIDKARAILKNSAEKYPLEIASCDIAEARLQIAEGSLKAADKSFKKALALQEAKLQPTQPSVLKTCKEYAALLDKLGRKADADKLRSRVDKEKGPESKLTASGSNKGSFLEAAQAGKAADQAGDKAKAIEAWQHAVSEAEKRPDLENQLPFALVRLGDEYRAKNQIADALKFYNRALSLREKTAANTLGLARNLERIALCYNAQKKWADSEQLLTRALDIEKKTEAGDQIIATTMESLLSACMANKDTKHAEIIANQLLGLAGKQTGAAASNNKRMATGVLGSIYIQTNRVDQGMKLMKELSKTPPDANAYQARKAEIEKETDQSELKK